jgi:Mg/Co/Ni transporter MgtE
MAYSMVVSMVAAGLAGALVPILLRRFGQDPALVDHPHHGDRRGGVLLVPRIATLFAGMLGSTAG